MPKFVIEKNCRYLFVVEAPDANAAVVAASKNDTPTDDWVALWQPARVIEKPKVVVTIHENALKGKFVVDDSLHEFPPVITDSANAAEDEAEDMQIQLVDQGYEVEVIAR